ncbi:MAG: hypothetical protein ACI4KF_01665 [Huintestinicola sp.]
MNKFMTVVTNKWFRVFVSLLGAVYSVLLAYFDYIVFFYDIEYTNKKEFAIIVSISSVLICLLFFYTRRSFFTCLFGMVNMVLFFPILLLDWGNWPLILPAALVTLFGFFCCHMNETAKTIFGTIYLLMYILGGIAFFLVMNVFRVTTVDTMIEKGVSPSGAFRYYVLDVQNKSTGKICVYVQPNTLDVDKGFIKLDSTIKKMVKQSPKPCEIECSWEGDTMLINGEPFFHESKYLAVEDGQTVYAIDGGDWSYTFFNLDYPIFDTIEDVKGKLDKLSDKLEEEENGSSDADADTEDNSGESADEDAEDTGTEEEGSDSESENADENSDENAEVSGE